MTDHNRLVEGEGIGAVYKLSHQLGYLFREIKQHDKGIDAELEITSKAYKEGQTPDIISPFIALQIKSRTEFELTANKKMISIQVKEQNLEYWRYFGRPVLLIAYSDEAIYWTRVDNATSKNIKISLNQVFNRDSISEFVKIMHQYYTEMAHRIDLKDKGHNSYNTYKNVIHKIESDPQLLKQMKEEDFTPATIRKSKQFTIIKPKVAIDCSLPVAFQPGDCTIEFSNTMLRGLTCHLSHKDILTKLMIGLNTPPHLETRAFLYKINEDTYKAYLGQTAVTLARQETIELCSCIDEVCQLYKDTILETERLLEAQNHKYIIEKDIEGYLILTVKRDLWNLMKEYATKFHYSEGKSKWHIFEHTRTSIEIYPHSEISARIYPLFQDGRLKDPRSNDYVQLLYTNPSIRLLDRKDEKSWKEYIGPNGIWSVAYTIHWLKKDFIREVISYYKIYDLLNQTHLQIGQKKTKKNFLSRIFPAKNQIRQHSNSYNIEEQIVKTFIKKNVFPEEDDYIPFFKIHKLGQLEDYIVSIQSWFHTYEAKNISAELLGDYYTTFAEISENMDLSDSDTAYIENIIKNKYTNLLEDQSLNTDLVSNNQSEILRLNAKRIKLIEYEDHHDADLVSRDFLLIMSNHPNYNNQRHINKLQESIRPIWEQLYFQHHYCLPLEGVAIY